VCLFSLPLSCVVCMSLHHLKNLLYNCVSCDIEDRRVGSEPSTMNSASRIHRGNEMGRYQLFHRQRPSSEVRKRRRQVETEHGCPSLLAITLVQSSFFFFFISYALARKLLLLSVFLLTRYAIQAVSEGLKPPTCQMSATTTAPAETFRVDEH